MNPENLPDNLWVSAPVSNNWSDTGRVYHIAYITQVGANLNSQYLIVCVCVSIYIYINIRWVNVMHSEVLVVYILTVISG
jgi:hypothetical protein